MTAENKKPGSPRQTYWLWVLCLVGLDYFSSLAYQPSIAFAAAGYLAPIATIGVVLFTLFGALPVYFYVCGKSPHGQGAIALLEKHIHGWRGKLLIVVLLGFAATDFVITRTLSVADAAEHLIHNPHPAWQRGLDNLSRADQSVRELLPGSWWQNILSYWNKQLVVTVLLSILGFTLWTIFRKGFRRRVIHVAIAGVASYVLLNAVVIICGLNYLWTHPQLCADWWNLLREGRWHPAAPSVGHEAWWTLGFLGLLAFPKVALGLSGFELSMVVMPIVRGHASDTPSSPTGRIRNTRKLLVAAVIVMSLLLLGSSLVTTLLIPPEALAVDGPAANRALAYLAHGGPLADGGTGEQISPVFGEAFGTLYDLVTILILCLAGASVALGLRDLVPDYLHRLGMEFHWAHNVGALLHLFNAINLVVTVLFRASVSAQRFAYATSVLTLICSASVAAGLDRYRQRSGSWLKRMPWFYAAVSVALLVSAIAAIVAKPDGLLIALCFIFAIILTSIVSRLFRSTELRFEGFEFKDAQSRLLWDSLKSMDFPVLVPHRAGLNDLAEKEAAIRARHRLTADVPLVFVQAEVGDASDFYHKPLVEIHQIDGRFVLHVSRSVSIPHVLAAIGLEMSRESKPPEIHFGWSNESPIEANVNFLLFGQGNIPWMVRDLIRRAEPNADRRPPIIIG
jgi:hypothetical protein